MYDLINFSQTELRALADLLQEKIEATTQHIYGIEKYVPPGDVKYDMLSKEHKRQAVLKEINVRVLTSLQIVKDRETTHAN